MLCVPTWLLLVLFRSAPSRKGDRLGQNCLQLNRDIDTVVNSAFNQVYSCTIFKWKCIMKTEMIFKVYSIKLIFPESSFTKKFKFNYNNIKKLISTNQYSRLSTNKNTEVNMKACDL